MFAIPDAHHLAHHLTARIGRRKFDDDARWNIVASERDAGELAHKPLAGADDLKTESGDSSFENLAQPFGRNIT